MFVCLFSDATAVAIFADALATTGTAAAAAVVAGAAAAAAAAVVAGSAAPGASVDDGGAASIVDEVETKIRNKTRKERNGALKNRIFLNKERKK